MRHRAPIGAVGVLVAVACFSSMVVAQSHKHYTVTTEADRPSPDGALAPRLQNLGAHTFPVSTRNESAQRFVNQGLNLTYGFNHAEAGRSFREAVRLDPACAMAFWGQALVLGPNINAPMDAADEPRAFDLVRQALALKTHATPREQAYIDALARRYTGKAADRAAGDRAYAAAMADVVRRFPADLDAVALYAESVMDLRPWGYWTPDGHPQEGIGEIKTLLESAMARQADHPGVLHFYIHLMEAVRPELAESAADRLLGLMPAAGHMVHMPSHIYQRVGRYDDAVRSNQMAVEADEDYITQCRAQGMYPMGYYPHNIHFLWWAATMDGRQALAIESARKVAAKVPDEALQQMPMLAGFRVIPYYAYVRFARWDDMLREPAPPASSPFMRGMWQYGRGMAFVAKGQLAEAEAALKDLDTILTDKSLDTPLFSPNSMAAVLRIAPASLAGEIAAARKDDDQALLHLEQAVRLEDALAYTEPAEWVYPPRHQLGHVLLRAGRPVEAEAVYWQDLRQHPNNGWALRGLVDALRAQGRADDAKVAEERLRKAWARSDTTLTASVLR